MTVRQIFFDICRFITANHRRVEMMKMSSLVAALLFAFASGAYAATSQTAPASTGSASVTDNLQDNKSNGKADKGLTNAESHITAQHGKADKDKSKEERAEHSEKHEHHADRVAKVERPAKIERPGK
jgi:basic membrane lipoprotein Med (substrate-binding protein (PBP1-ABC) superfamily)